MRSKVKASYAIDNSQDLSENLEIFELINNTCTFEDVFKALNNKADIYTVLGCTDESVRKYVFQKLSEKLNCDYDYIYKLWKGKGNEETNIKIVIPLEGDIKIPLYADNWETAVKCCMETAKWYADKSNDIFGALKDIHVADDVQSIEDALLKDGWTEGESGSIHLSVNANLLVAVKAINNEAALNYLKNDLEFIHESLSDKSIVGELKNISFDVNKIEPEEQYKSQMQDEEKDSENETIEEPTL